MSREPELFNAAEYLVDRQIAAGLGDRVAVIDPHGSHTYRELADRVHLTAGGLREIGLAPEQRIVLFSADRAELLTIFLAALHMGAIPVPVSTMYNAVELAELCRDARARALFVSPEFAETASAALERCPVDLRTDTDALRTNFGGLATVDGRTEHYPTWAESPAFWLYTSGTTGTPKAAMHRHGSVRYVAETYGAQVLGIGPEDRCFSVARLFFAYGLGNAALFPLSVGATTILDPARPTPESVERVLREHRPTLFFGVPTFFAALLAAEVKPDAFSSVRLAISAGEPLPVELQRRFTDRFGVDIVDGIGSTEALHIFLSNRPGDVRPGTTGKPVPGYDVQLVDDNDAVVAAGTPGHLQIRGGSLATGYWCRTDATRAAFRGDWMRTGDTYLEDAEGYFTCLGRSDDMIKAGGIWVSPGEVEACLLAQPGVAQAAVVAVPDANGLDKPVACVVASPGAILEPDALIAACRESLAAFKRPRHVLIVDALPTTATGKVKRFEVRTIARDLLEQAHA